MRKAGFIPGNPRGRQKSNNQSVIRMLSKEYAGHNRGRNRILLAAVSLCIVTLTMVFGIAYGKVQAEYTKAARAAGTAASACIENAGLSHYQKVRSLNYVKQAGRSVSVGEAIAKAAAGRKEMAVTGAAEEEKRCRIQVLDKPAWENIIKPAYTDIHGDYPKEKQEIMLSLGFLKDMGIERPKKGMEFCFQVSIGLFRSEEETFYLGGWYTDYTDIPSDSGVGYISEAKYKDWGYDIEKESDILICQSDNMDWRETEERLYQDVTGKGSDLEITVRNTYAYDAVKQTAGSYGMAFLGALVVLSGMFFLIHNVMQISMAGDVRQMGLLNTIGTTKKQIRNIYFGQIVRILIPSVLAGVLLSAAVLRVVIPKMLGNQYLSGYGGAGELRIFRPEILLLAVLFAVLLTVGAAAGVIRHAVNMSCVESLSYQGKNIVQKSKPARRNRRKRSAGGELWYMAWQNLNRYRGRFWAAVFSLFLGLETVLGTVVITRGSDYIHVIEKRPDFLIAGEFSDWGQGEGYGKEYKTRDAGQDPMKTEGDNFCLLYGNEYDEFEPVSSEVRDAVLSLDGVRREESYVMEGAYMISTISREGLRPLVNKYSDMQEDEKEGTGFDLEYAMVEGGGKDVIQILRDEEIHDLWRYAQDNRLPVDMESLQKGTGVMILHDHQLSPKETELAERSVGEAVYFTAMRSREEYVTWYQSDSDERETLKEEKKQSEVFSISGYMDNQAEGFPDIRQTWHGSEGAIYYLISEKGFSKLPTEKKTLYMELNVEKEKEPFIKAEIQNLLSRENLRREKTGNGVDGEEGEAGIFCISKSDLVSEAEYYVTGNRRILGSISLILLFAGLTNYFNVMMTGILARKKEMEIMESIGMTRKQKQKMLLAEGMYYCLTVGALILTAGSVILRLICAYMENQLSYFAGSYPLGWTAALLAGLAVVCYGSVAAFVNSQNEN